MNWWESAPLADQAPAVAPAPWEAAPLAAAASQGEPMGPIEAGLVGAGDTLTAGHPGAVAEFLRGPEGRSEVEARVAKARQDQPTAFDVGGYLTYAIPGGGAAAKGAGMAIKGAIKAGPRIAETGLRAGGFATRWGGGLSALLHGNLPGAYVAWEAGKKAKALADVMKASRTVAKRGFQGTGDPFSGPAKGIPRIDRLSPEMQAKSDAYQAFLRRHALNAEEPVGRTGPANWPPGLADALRRMRQ